MIASQQAIEGIKAVLSRVSPVSADESYRIGAQIRDAKRQVIARYKPVFSPDNLDNLTSEDFRSFLLFKNNQHWDRLHRQSGSVTADMNKLRNALRLLLDERLPIKTRLDRLRPGNGEPMVKGLGRAVITAILQIMYPDEYGVLNNTAEQGMKKTKLWPEFPRGASFGERYEMVNKVLVEVAPQVGTDLWTLDMLWWRLGTAHVPKGIGSAELCERSESEQETDVDPSEGDRVPESVFGLERHLHEFLVDNWEATELSNDWSLLEEDGEITGSHYSAQDVGEIDLLARHRKSGRWLVIELKRDQTSDSTVGQILRYMAWVRKNLAKAGESVKGLIICHQMDLKMRYALDGQADITCMTYEVNFLLRPAPMLA